MVVLLPLLFLKSHVDDHGFGCRSPEDLALTVEEVLCGLYPSGVQGAEEAGLKPWTMHDIEVEYSFLTPNHST
jgi:hypothetical protein